MSQIDEDTKDFIRILYHVADSLMAFQRIKSYPDCNTCDKKTTCQYRPKPGEQTRINCPLWEGR